MICTATEVPKAFTFGAIVVQIIGLSDWHCVPIRGSRPLRGRASMSQELADALEKVIEAAVDDRHRLIPAEVVDRSSPGQWSKQGVDAKTG
jgi:hypothetical protein